MSAGNSAYSPLPQSNSDSDCSFEEELHLSQGNSVVNRAAKVQNSRSNKTFNEENNIINYKPLDNDGDIGVTLNKFHPNFDEVSIVKPDDSLEIFSTSRKICFLFSLLLCVFTTVAFLWILPCNVGSCPNASDLKKYNFTWEENLPNIEIYGPITLVPDHSGNQNLLFLTKSFFNSQKNYSKSSLRCLKGMDGSPSWEITLDDDPTDVDCKLLDVNGDGLSDCLIYGNNFLRAIHSLSGEKLWDIQEANIHEQKIYFKDFPLVIPDLDKDEVKELLLPCSFSLFDEGKQGKITLQNNLVIISGKTGAVINKPLQLKLCSAIMNLVLENNSILSYTCFLSDKKETFQNISLTEIYKTLKNWSSRKINQLKWEILNQHRKASDTAYVNGFRIVLKNHGNCPEDCHIIVEVNTEDESSKNKTVYSFNQKNTFGMTPVVFNNKKESGFIIKYWKWHSKTENIKFGSQEFSPTVQQFLSAPKTDILKNNVKNLTKRSKKLNYLLDNSKFLENKMLLESEYEFRRKKRTATKLRKNKLERSAFTNSLHVISETISKIALNTSYLSASNLTENEIIQICKKPQICQPEVNNQKHSVLVTQLVADGTEALVTFNSKYVHEKGKGKGKDKRNSKGWQIQSTIRVFNL